MTTSQQLQELRDAFAEAEGINVFGPEDGGAWQTERAMGIGYRVLNDWPLLDSRPVTVNASAEMGELRERAYPGLSGTAVDELERTFGIPYSWRMHLDQWPELPQPSWMGEPQGVGADA